MAVKRHQTHFDITAQNSTDAALNAVERNLHNVESAAQSMGNAFRTVLGAGVAIGLTRELAKVVFSAIDAGDQLVKMSQKSGFAIERLGELKHGASLAGVDLQQLAVGLREFNKSITEATDPTSKAAQIFRELGVDVRKGPDAALREFADALSRMADGSTKATLATEILGKAGSDLIPFLNGGAAGMDSAAEEARKLGLVMSQEAALAAEKFNDNLTRLASSSAALGIAIADPALPALDAMAKKLLEVRTKGLSLAGTLENLAAVMRLLPGAPAMAGGAISAGLAAGRMLGPDRGGADLWQRLKNLNLNGLDADLQAGAPPRGAPNSKALDRILAGGKNGDDTVAKDIARRAEEIQQARMAAARDEEAITQRNNDARIRENERVNQATQKSDYEGLLAQERAMDERDELERSFKLDKIKRDIDAAEEAAHRFDDAINTAFDRAVRGGGKMIDVLKNLGMELVNIEIQKRIFAPASKAIGAGLDQFFAGMFSGAGAGASGATAADALAGARAGGGPVMGGQSYLVGERGPEIFTPGTGGNIVPNGARAGAVVNQTINFSANTPAAVRAAVFEAAPAIAEMAKAGIENSLNRGSRRYAPR